MKTFLWRIIDSEKAFRATLTVAMLVICAAMVSTVPTGCTTTGGGTNTFNVTAAATAIKAVLGPLVVYEENADPSTVVDFQTASAALGVLISNSSTDTAALSAALQSLGKTDLVKLAISEAVGLYAIYLGQAVANGVSQNDTAKVLLQAFKDALDSGVKAQTVRVKAQRAAVKTK